MGLSFGNERVIKFLYMLEPSYMVKCFFQKSCTSNPRFTIDGASTGVLHQQVALVRQYQQGHELNMALFMLLSLNKDLKRKFLPLNNQQETVRMMRKRPLGKLLRVKTGSPETRRGITLLKKDKSPFLYSQHRKSLDPFWIAGFFEGDGCFGYDFKSKTLSIMFTQLDPKVLYKIKHSFSGKGAINITKEGYWRYTLKGKQNLKDFALLMERKIFLKQRLLQFERWVSFYNQKYKASLKLNFNPALFSLNNSWLCGFADADGSFAFRLTRRTKSQWRLRLRFYLDQKNAKEDLHKIQEQLAGTIIQRKYNNKKTPYWRLIIDVFRTVPLIINYFNRFPPKTTTLSIGFKRYQRIYQWYVDKIWKEKLLDIFNYIHLNKKLNKREAIMLLKNKNHHLNKKTLKRIKKK